MNQYSIRNILLKIEQSGILSQKEFRELCEEMKFIPYESPYKIGDIFDWGKVEKNFKPITIGGKYVYKYFMIESMYFSWESGEYRYTVISIYNNPPIKDDDGMDGIWGHRREIYESELRGITI